MSVNFRNASAMDARRRHSMRETSGRLGKFMPQISPDERGINIKTCKKITCKPKKKLSLHDTYVMRHAQQLLDKPQIKLLGRASDTTPSDDRTSTCGNNKNYHFVCSNPKIKRMLMFDAQA
jgi:hypothetical protein